MLQNVNAEIISIGTEILLGELTDTNSVHIARVLRDLGINLYYMTSVGDNEERIAEAIRIALSRAQIVITCGGLGPTVDDKTRDAVARATKRGLTFHQNLLDQIAARFASFQVKMTENNRQQAYLPDRAIVIENPVGTAPSFIVEHGDGIVVSLPGVPREMKFLFAQKVVPFLRERYALGIIKARTLKTAGVGESMLDEMIGRDLLEMTNPTIGLAAHSGQVDVRITAKADTAESADQMIAVIEEAVRTRIGQHIYGVDDDQLEDVLAAFLHEKSLRLVLVEAGLRVVRSDDVVTGDAIRSTRYAHPQALRQELGLTADISLSDLALQAAKDACVRNNTHVSIAVVSDPDVEEAADATPGTAVVVYTPEKTRSRVYGFGAKSEIGRHWVTTWSLSNAWQLLKEFYDR